MQSFLRLLGLENKEEQVKKLKTIIEAEVKSLSLLAWRTALIDREAEAQTIHDLTKNMDEESKKHIQAVLKEKKVEITSDTNGNSVKKSLGEGLKKNLEDLKKLISKEDYEAFEKSMAQQYPNPYLVFQEAFGCVIQ